MIDINKRISFAIINSDIGFIINRIQDLLVSFFKHNKQYIFETTTIDYSIILKKESILKYEGFIFRNFLNKIIYFDNTGEAYHSLIWNICTKNEVECIYIRMTCDSYIYPAYILHYYNKKCLQRTIQCYKDGNKWVFYTNGETQEFENPSFYLNKIKKQKFNRKIIIKYLRNMGIDILNNNIWKPIDKPYRILRN